MALTTKKKSLEAALEIANKVRARLGYSPVDRLYPGVPHNAASCAITETVYDDDLDRAKWDVMTAGGLVRVWDKTGPDFMSNRWRLDATVVEEWKKTPGAASFVHYFDAGKFPDLVKKM